MSTNCMCRVVYFFKSHCYKSPLCLSPPLLHYTGARIQGLYMYCFAGEIFIFAKKIYSESGKPWKGQRSVEVRDESRRAVISSPFVSEWRWKMGRQLLRHQRNCFSQSFFFSAMFIYHLNKSTVKAWSRHWWNTTFLQLRRSQLAVFKYNSN